MNKCSAVLIVLSIILGIAVGVVTNSGTSLRIESDTLRARQGWLVLNSSSPEKTEYLLDETLSLNPDESRSDIWIPKTSKWLVFEPSGANDVRICFAGIRDRWGFSVDSMTSARVQTWADANASQVSTDPRCWNITSIGKRPRIAFSSADVSKRLLFRSVLLGLLSTLAMLVLLLPTTHLSLRWQATVLVVALSSLAGILTARDQSSSARHFRANVLFAAEAEYRMSLVGRGGTPFFKESQPPGPLKVSLSPVLGYRALPNQQTRRFTTDENGFRATPTNHGSATDLAVITGGSSVFGFGLDSDSSTLSSCLARSLPKYQWINAGMSGYLFEQEAALVFEQIDRWKPALILSVTGWNDIMLWTKLRADLYPNEFFLSLELEDRLGAGAVPDLSSVDVEKSYAQFVKKFSANLLKVHQLAQLYSSRYVFAIQPRLATKLHKTALEEELELKAVSHLDSGLPTFSSFYDRFRNDILVFCERHSIECIDLNRRPHYLASRSELFIDDVHPNETGNIVIANDLTDALSSDPSSR